MCDAQAELRDQVNDEENITATTEKSNTGWQTTTGEPKQLRIINTNKNAENQTITKSLLEHYSNQRMED